MRHIKKAIFGGLVAKTLIFGIASLSASSIQAIPAGAPLPPGYCSTAPYYVNGVIMDYTPIPCAGGGSSSSGTGGDEYANYFLGFAWTLNNKPFFNRMEGISSYSSNISDDQWNGLKQQTLAQCQKATGGQCEYQRGYTNTCVAVASNPVDNFYAWGDDSYKNCNAAKQKAIAKCQRDSKTSPNQCKIVETAKNPGFWNMKVPVR